MNTQKAALLLVEDDNALRRQLEKGLSEMGYDVATAADLAQAREHITKRPASCILLDLGLPDGNGFTFLEELRGSGSVTPVLILTARDQVEDKIRGLDLGADDYLVKPFDFNELTARIRAHLRRSGGTGNPVISVGDLEIDQLKRTLRRGQDMIECTPREFDVLVCLAQAAGSPVSRQTLMTEVWKVRSRMTSMDNVMDVLMSRLREKIDSGRDTKLIHTVRGIGFMMKSPS